MIQSLENDESIDESFAQKENTVNSINNFYSDESSENDV